jgi:DNA-binding XRE family transcriptional regulator
VVSTQYPHDFPKEAQANVEAEKIRAGEAFDKAKEQLPASKWGAIPEVEKLLKQLILSVFAVFAHEACELGRRGVWPVVHLHSECREFLRHFTLEAYTDKGYDTNGNSVPRRLTDTELKESPEWKKSAERLEVAELQSAPPKLARESEPTADLNAGAPLPATKSAVLAGEAPIDPWYIKLRKLRDKRRLTREKLAAELGLSADAVKKHEEGYLPKPPNQQVYADFFQIPKEELFPPDE